MGGDPRLCIHFDPWGFGRSRLSRATTARPRALRAGARQVLVEAGKRFVGDAVWSSCIFRDDVRVAERKV